MIWNILIFILKLAAVVAIGTILFTLRNAYIRYLIKKNDNINEDDFPDFDENPF